MAAVRVTWATRSRAVGEKTERAPGALTDPEQHRTGTNYIALICLFQHLLIKSHSLGPGRCISMTDLYVNTDACVLDTEQHEDWCAAVMDDAKQAPLWDFFFFYSKPKS